MLHHLFNRTLLVAISVFVTVGHTKAQESDLETLLHQFQEYSGAQLVFHRDDLPDGRYHDILKPLAASRKTKAASICLREARKYPPGYFGEVGLKAVGVFAACVSKKGDGFRPFIKELGGYRYFGVYNRLNAIAAAYYNDGQLPLTFHHEIFHHIDSTVNGQTESWHLGSDDPFFQAAISGRQRYTAPAISRSDLAALRARAQGSTLHGAVSDYAAKSSREDQAETARHLMSTLPDALLQAIEQPRVPGSQRILHVVREYERAVPHGPSFEWFVDVATGASDSTPQNVQRTLDRLKAFANRGVTDDPQSARATLRTVAHFDPATIPPEKAANAVRHATQVTQALLKQRIRPDTKQQRFTVWGQEDAAGVNMTLRCDLIQFRVDAVRLKRIALIDKQPSDLLTRAHMKNLRLIARYYTYIKSNWSVTPGTQVVFNSLHDTLCGSLPSAHASLTKRLRAATLLELARRIPEDGEPQLIRNSTTPLDKRAS